MNILVTSIGSMSAQCVISSLRRLGHFVVGTDIYPENWHSESKLCNKFFQIPLCKEYDYVPTLLNIISENDISLVIPLTDVEIDVLNEKRACFDDIGVILCMPSPDIIEIVRDKYNLYNYFKQDDCIHMPQTYLNIGIDVPKKFPLLAKIRNGRSSEGLFWINTHEDLQYILTKRNYIIQEKIDGYIVTVDFIRSRKNGVCVAIPRRELLRTSNGAGLTVEIYADERLFAICKYIGDKLNINGCVNFEFIESDNAYYLIDINPRFSAGIAFSYKVGYDLPKNNLNCFMDDLIDNVPTYKQTIITKKYVEQILL